MLTFESGCRAGELLALRLRDFAFDEYGAKVRLSGKTGPRRIRLVAAVPYLTEWLNKHPKADDPSSFMWVDASGSPIGYGTFYRMLRILARRAGVKRRVNPHNFRHSRATILANHLTEAQMKEYFGWVQGSDMASVYVHLSGRDVDKAILGVYGIQQESKQDARPQIQPKECTGCTSSNPASNRFCSKCGQTLDSEVCADTIKQEMERKEADQVLDEMLEDEQFRRAFVRRLKEVAVRTEPVS